MHQEGKQKEKLPLPKKLILFDIDGTLVLTGGIAMGKMVEAVSRVTGFPVQWHVRDFVGYTDRYILRTLLQRCGVSEGRVEDLTEAALSYYLEGIRDALRSDGAVRVLPGVKALLEALSRDKRFALGLLTGNVREGAHYKLAPVGLERYFPVGAYGDDALLRDDLPPVAIQRTEKHYQCFFEKKDIWIIGDSVNDIRCAHAHHLRSLAVGTGKIPAEELRKYRPDVFLPDLTPTEKIIRILSQ